MRTSLIGQVALVTGSTAGIGLAAARSLSRNGATVVLNGRRSEIDAASTLATFPEAAQVLYAPSDITTWEGAQKLVQVTLEQTERIDVLVVSGAAPDRAGMLPTFFRDLAPGTMLEWANAQWASRLFVLKAALESMIANGGGKVVFVTSDAGRVATPSETGAGGAAAALIISTKVLARELGRHGIRVNAVSVTVTAGTPGAERSLESGESRKVFERALERQLFPVTADDVAQAILFFAAPASDGITGQTLSVNGGLSFPG